jgi:hypothetical protein
MASWTLAAAALTSACFGTGGEGMRATAPSVPSELAKCKVAASHENPLVTEWPASEKANLEARLREGTVVVSYSGCAMKLLPQCRVQGNYGFRRTTTSTDVIEIHDSDELYAKLPLGAVSLEGELERSGRLAVQTTVSGQLELRGWNRSVPEDPACTGATHVMGALSVGAFKLRSGGTVSAKGGAGVPVVGAASAGTSSSESLLKEAGSPEACKDSTNDSPSAECNSPIQIFLWPLPKELADRGPPGTVKVNFLSANPDHEYDVGVNDRVLCKTPCDRWVDPAIPFSFRYERGLFQQNERIEMPDLRDYQASGDRLDARAHPTQTGKLVTGMMMTTFGGLGVATGITLAAIGCPSDDKKSLCTAGVITFPVGVGLTIPGILLMVNARSRVEITPATPHTGMPPEAARPTLFTIGGKL